MEASNDFKELLELFSAHGVESLVVGGYALAFYGAPRFTGDLDLWVNPTPANAKKTLAALKDFGFALLGLMAGDFIKMDHVVQLGVPPLRVDPVTAIDGVTWKTGWGGKKCGEYGDIKVWFLGRREFVANKRATGRRKDLAYLEALGESDGKP